MSFVTKLKLKIKKNNSLFAYLYSIKYCRNYYFQKSIRAMTGEDATLLLIEGNYNLTGDIYYLIDCGSEKDDLRGFFALIRHNIKSICFAEAYGLVPCVIWGKGCIYHDCRMDHVTQNVFEYYYEPISLHYNEVLGKHQYVRMRDADNLRIPDQMIKEQTYVVDDHELEKLAEIYGRYFHLNKKTQSYIDSGIQSIMQEGDKIIGVHVRGTDFKNQFNNHPEFCGFIPFVDAAKQMMKEGDYNKIFLATEDNEVIDLFNEEFDDKVIYYQDCIRGRGKTSVVLDKRGYGYGMGLEVLRDVYTLAQCDSFLYGLSQVAFAVRYIKESRNEQFSQIRQIEMRVNKNRNDDRSYYQKLKNHG